MKSVVKILGGGAFGLMGVGVIFQEVGIGDSTPRHATPRCSNQVCLDTILLGVVSVTDLTAIYLKYLDTGISESWSRWSRSKLEQKET